MVLNGKININSRLEKAMSFADKCRCMADIGSDHGYGSIFAIQNGIADTVIATDISKPSLAKTQRLVEEYSFSDKITCRVGDGFKALNQGEADVAFIAGMGADLIADIIENSHEIAKNLDYMILQPMNSAEPLRRRLIKMGYKIDREGIALDNGKFYQIIRCSRGEQILSDIQYELGTYVFSERIPLCAEYISHMIEHYGKILNYVGDNDTLAAQDRIVYAQKKTEEYRRALEWALSE